jgi:5-methylcytosine-specific restriction endonuclease McrA
MAYNSTIINKKKICVKCGKLDYWFSKKMCKGCTTISSTTKRVDKYDEEIQEASWQNLCDDLDAIFSRYIRLRDADENGMVKCYTCPVIKPISEMQCGHFIPRANLATRWLPENCKPQCKGCNEFKDGALDAFAAHLEQDNFGAVDSLNELKRERYKPGISDLKQLIQEYRHKVKFLQVKLKKNG